MRVKTRVLCELAAAVLLLAAPVLDSAPAHADTDAAHNFNANPGCNGKVWVLGLQGDHDASSTLSVDLDATTVKARVFLQF